MPMAMSVDVWVRGTNQARTEVMAGVPENAAAWTEADVRHLLTEMLLALERVQNPGGDPPPVSLRGFSWIVSPEIPTTAKSPALSPSSATDGVLLHLETGQYHELNSIGSAIWELLDGRRSVSEVVITLRSRVEDAPGDLHEIVEESLIELKQRELIT